jgi:hypothetical protein
MPYLTYDEYISLGFPEIDQTEFEKLLKKAEDVLDSVTRSFYRFHDIETDIPFRRDKFKKALACQIEYFHDIGAISTHEINNPLSVQIGRTQISTGEANQKKTNTIVAPDVFLYLSETGLLYRGVGVVG